MPVRSARIFGPYRPAAAGAFEQVYVVPSGRTLRTGWLSVLNYHNAAQVCAFLLGSSGSELSFWRQLVPADSTIVLEDELVLNPGDRLSVFAAASRDVTFTGAGSLLFGAPT